MSKTPNQINIENMLARMKKVEEISPYTKVTLEISKFDKLMDFTTDNPGQALLGPSSYSKNKIFSPSGDQEG